MTDVNSNGTMSRYYGIYFIQQEDGINTVMNKCMLKEDTVNAMRKFPCRNVFTDEKWNDILDIIWCDRASLTCKS